MNRKPTAPTEEIEVEADYVNSAVCTVDKTAATPDQKFVSFTRSFSPVAGCWVILIVIMALRIHFTSVISENNSMLTAQNQELETKNQQLETQNQQLETGNQQLGTQNQKLETQNQQLETQNQQLKTERKNLTDMLQDMETEKNELNVTRAQWSIDQYCPIDREDVRKCNSCQAGWLQEESSCYAVNDARPPNLKTWDEAQADCKERNSELVVINSLKEKEYVRRQSLNAPGVDGYWIGLRVVDGKWTWVGRSGLTEISWILRDPPTEGHCVKSVQYEIRHIGLTSVNCGDRHAWICEKKALSLTPH